MFSKMLDMKEVKAAQKTIAEAKKEITKIIVGQDTIVDSLLRTILSNGHLIVEGVPGVAKTLIIRTFAKITGCSYSRIQFTVDMLPTDISGLTIYEKIKGFVTVKGPIF